MRKYFHGGFFMTEIIDVDGFDVTVEFDYDSPCIGSRDEFGAQMEPDEPGCFTIYSAVFYDEEACEEYDAMKEEHDTVCEDGIINVLTGMLKERERDAYEYAMERKYGI